MPFIAQFAHPQPQDDLPCFLFFLMFIIINETMRTKHRLIKNVPRFIFLFPFQDYFLYVFASVYFLKKSMYKITASAAIAKTRPIMFTLPVKSPPNWLTISATT